MTQRARRRKHSLHRCGGAAEFTQCLERETGMTLDELLAGLVTPDDVDAILVGGSIPFGIATSVSDVDLMVLLRRGRASLNKSCNKKLHSARYVGDVGLVSDETVVLAGGIEVDVQFLRGERVIALSEALSQAQAGLTPQELLFLGRIKTGWRLKCELDFQERYRSLLANNFLEVHTALREYYGALKELEDAWAAVETMPRLALHLGRAAVDKVCIFLLTSRGYASIGSKWIRLVETRRLANGAERWESLLQRGIELLFPIDPMTDPSPAKPYLRDVASFMRAAKSAAEAEPILKIAFSASLQVYDPEQAESAHDEARV